jgi:hypothetical protein
MEAKPYYSLSVGGVFIKVRYLNPDNQQQAIENSPNLAVAWLEGKDTKTHCFLLRLADFTYVLSAKHFPRSGMKVTIIQFLPPREVNTLKDVYNAGKFSKNVKPIPSGTV